MRFRNRETPTHAGSDGNQITGPDVVEVLELVDRNNNVVASFTKNVSGQLALLVDGDLSVTGAAEVSNENVIATAPAAHIEDPTGAVTDQDDEARAAIVSILNALEAAGIVAAA